MTDGFEEIMAQPETSPKVEALARQAKSLIEDVTPNVVEVAWPHQRNIGYGFGPRKMSEQFCYIGVLKDRINLGFYYGADLDDPKGLLEGTGQNMRHIKIGEAEQLEVPAVRDLVVAASQYLPKLK